MDSVLELSLLFDFYEELLTEHQREIFVFYYCEDFSLSEVATKMGITRQAVNGQLIRVKALLYKYESILGLVASHAAISNSIRNLDSAISSKDYNAISAAFQNLRDCVQ